ncbi:unnamed protein product [marine sediment metagenome]|uniref:Uncharacterized protein n=1 Tax=marine sediment metagenome TaxID=412755 RepID=X1F2K1_9ZZZZ
MKWFDKNMKIKSSEIATNESEKIKGNWFIYEFSNSIYDSLLEFFEFEEEASNCHVLSDKEIKSFSISMANKTVDMIKQWKSGQIKELEISGDLLKSILNNEGMTNMIDSFVDIIAGSLNNQLDICQGCPTEKGTGLNK